MGTLFPEGPQDLKNASARAETRSPLTKRHPARPPAGPGQGASTPAAAGLRPDGWSPQRRGDPNEGARWHSHLHNLRVLARLHASSAPPRTAARAQPSSRRARRSAFRATPEGGAQPLLRPLLGPGSARAPLAKVTGGDGKR